MSNKIPMILLICSAMAYCPTYAGFSEDSYVSLSADRIETLHVKGEGMVLIREDERCKNNEINYSLNFINNVLMDGRNNSVTFNTNNGIEIFLPKNIVVKKVIDIKQGIIDILGGKGDITITNTNGEVTLKPTVWGTTNITLDKGNVDLRGLDENSNVMFDLYAKKEKKVESHVAGLQLTVTYSWWWPHFKGTLGDETKSKLIKVWASTGAIFLNKRDVFANI